MTNGMERVSEDLGKALPAANVPSLHIEIHQNSHSTAKAEDLKKRVWGALQSQSLVFEDTVFRHFEDPFLQNNVVSVTVCGSDIDPHKNHMLSLDSSDVQLHVYQLNEEGPGQEELDEDDMSAACHWLLPSLDLNGIWESLVFDSEIKTKLLNYVCTTMLFADKKVDCNIIAWNRVILLHGPPGTGKTSLCKALAQKLCIRMSDYYSYGQLIEINSHSLFSKWFSESGKLVMKMFQKIQDLVDDKDALVCVLIDEVESLTAARKSCMSGSEPSDAIRVVNALLTQIDQIRKHSNVIILTTSNITGAIDLAFIDRADIKQYIGPPSPLAIYSIFKSCVEELMRTGIIYPRQPLLPVRNVEILKNKHNEGTEYSVQLFNIATKSHGFSGRTLRKLPFLAHAMFLQAPKVTLVVFLDALSQAVDEQFQERKDLIRD